MAGCYQTIASVPYRPHIGCSRSTEEIRYGRLSALEGQRAAHEVTNRQNGKNGYHKGGVQPADVYPLLVLSICPHVVGVSVIQTAGTRFTAFHTDLRMVTKLMDFPNALACASAIFGA